MRTAAIVDYGIGNIDSVVRGVEECGARAIVTDNRAELTAADCLILPGVGAYASGMALLRERELDGILGELVIDGGVPLLGLCLGMQLLASRSHENGCTEGLGWIPGEVRRIPQSEPGTRVPHVGWNQVVASHSSRLLDGIPDGSDFYFVHSYHVVCDDPADVVATTPYAGGVVAAVQRGSIFGVQFHPEKSQRHGLRLLANFLSS